MVSYIQSLYQMKTKLDCQLPDKPLEQILSLPLKRLSEGYKFTAKLVKGRVQASSEKRIKMSNMRTW